MSAVAVIGDDVNTEIGPDPVGTFSLLQTLFASNNKNQKALLMAGAALSGGHNQSTATTDAPEDSGKVQNDAPDQGAKEHRGKEEASQLRCEDPCSQSNKIQQDQEKDTVTSSETKNEAGSPAQAAFRTAQFDAAEQAQHQDAVSSSQEVEVRFDRVSLGQKAQAGSKSIKSSLHEIKDLSQAPLFATATDTKVQDDSADEIAGDSTEKYEDIKEASSDTPQVDTTVKDAGVGLGQDEVMYAPVFDQQEHTEANLGDESPDPDESSTAKTHTTNQGNHVANPLPIDLPLSQSFGTHQSHSSNSTALPGPEQLLVPSSKAKFSARFAGDVILQETVNKLSSATLHANPKPSSGTIFAAPTFNPESRGKALSLFSNPIPTRNSEVQVAGGEGTFTSIFAEGPLDVSQNGSNKILVNGERDTVSSTSKSAVVSNTSPLSVNKSNSTSSADLPPGFEHNPHRAKTSSLESKPLFSFRDGATPKNSFTGSKAGNNINAFGKAGAPPYDLKARVGTQTLKEFQVAIRLHHA
ncbi:hypothetical protein BCR34DRAFT_613140, partial [Clohesyomyces aquaticus]